MSSKPNCVDNDHNGAPLAGQVAETVAIASGRDPFVALEDLLELVEALCPRWPARSDVVHGQQFLL
jgi:hypothetical protein